MANFVPLFDLDSITGMIFPSGLAAIRKMRRQVITGIPNDRSLKFRYYHRIPPPYSLYPEAYDPYSVIGIY